MDERNLIKMYAQLGKLEAKNDIDYTDRLTEWDGQNHLYLPTEIATVDKAQNRLAFLTERETQQRQALENFGEYVETVYQSYVSEWKHLSFEDILSRLDVMSGIQQIYYYLTGNPVQEHLAMFTNPIGILLDYLQDQGGNTSDEELESYIADIESHDYSVGYDLKEAFQTLDDLNWNEIDHPPILSIDTEQDDSPVMG